MSRYEKLLWQVLRGTSDANIGYDDLRWLLFQPDFEERIRGSHHIFRRQDVEDKINLQREGNKAKPSQVRPVRSIIVKYRLGDEEP